MSAAKNVETILTRFRTIEERDEATPFQALQADVGFHWPPILPYGRASRELKREGPKWSETWLPLQTTAAERKLYPRVMAPSDDEVVVL